MQSMRLLSLLLEVHVMNLKSLVREKTSGVNDSLNKTGLDALLLQIYIAKNFGVKF